jgi:hypothetical protein
MLSQLSYSPTSNALFLLQYTRRVRKVKAKPKCRLPPARGAPGVLRLDTRPPRQYYLVGAGVVELADTVDSKSTGP